MNIKLYLLLLLALLFAIYLAMAGCSPQKEECEEWLTTLSLKSDEGKYFLLVENTNGYHFLTSNPEESIWSKEQTIPPPVLCYRDICLSDQYIFLVGVSGAIAYKKRDSTHWETKRRFYQDKSESEAFYPEFITGNVCGEYLFANTYRIRIEDIKNRRQMSEGHHDYTWQAWLIKKERSIYILKVDHSRNSLVINKSDSCGDYWTQYAEIHLEEIGLSIDDIKLKIREIFSFPPISFDVIEDQYWVGFTTTGNSIILIMGNCNEPSFDFHRFEIDDIDSLRDVEFWDKKRGLLAFKEQVFCTDDGGGTWKILLDERSRIVLKLMIKDIVVENNGNAWVVGDFYSYDLLRISGFGNTIDKIDIPKSVLCPEENP